MEAIHDKGSLNYAKGFDHGYKIGRNVSLDQLIELKLLLDTERSAKLNILLNLRDEIQTSGMLYDEEKIINRLQQEINKLIVG